MELRINNQRTFGTDQLSGIRLVRQIDLITGRLIPDAMTVRLRCGQSLQPETEGQKTVELYHKGRLQATQVLNRCTREADTQTLECQTDLDFLSLEFSGGLYVNKSLNSLMKDLLGDRGYELSPDMDSFVSGHIPICDRSRALEMVTFAQCAYMRMNSLGHFCMERLSLENPVLLENERILEAPVMVSLPEYSRVELVSHSYRLGSIWETVFREKEFPNLIHTYTFTEPKGQYQITNGEIKESAYNYVTFLPGESETLLALPYLHGRKWLSIRLLSGRDRMLSVQNNTLVGSHNENQVLECMNQRVRLNHQLKLRIFVENEVPGQAVAVETPWGSRFEGVISRMDSHLTPERHTAEITICGREV